MILTSISTTHLTNLETGQFINRFLIDFKEANLVPAINDGVFSTYYNQLVTQAPLYEKSLLQLRANAETTQLSELDATRDKGIITLRRALRVYRYTTSEPEERAYQLLDIVFNTYKGLEKESLEAETLGIDKLLTQLLQPKHLEAVNLLGLSVHVQKLQTANEAFKTVFNKRSTHTMVTETYDTKAHRKELLKTYNDCAEYVFVMAKNTKTQFFIDTLNAMNNGRKYFSDLLAKKGR